MSKLDYEGQSSPEKLWRLLQKGFIQDNLSDVHWMPSLHGYECKKRLNSGKLVPWFSLTKSVADLFLNYLKANALIDLTQRRIPQEGVFRGDLSSYRISCCPVLHGERVAIRRLDVSSKLDLLGVDNLDKSLDFIINQIGLFLIIGPTGAGKTHSLAYLMKRLAYQGKHVVSMEQPVEIDIVEVSQIPLLSHQKFSEWTHVVLRQDPDVIVLGELRDVDDCHTVMQLVRTGHHCLATMHALNILDVIERFSLLGYASKWLRYSVSGLLMVRFVEGVFYSELVTQDQWQSLGFRRSATLAEQRLQATVQDNI
ncbi:MAG TPA: ATPase, T2SS/T4P/T4SS family [Gammaproteobacteria bacterium]|nr:ATPase, T2SS/T4P/T4SS family [Gammaproteobacteria bacterium]